MWVIFLSTIVIQGISPGTAELKDLPQGADVFVKGQNCVVNLDGNLLRGDPDCPFTVAVMSNDGSVERVSGVLSGLEDDEEDRPPVLVITASAGSAERTTEGTQSKGQSPPNSNTGQTTQSPRRATETFSPYSRIYLERDQGPFGFVGVGLGVGARLMNSMRIGVTVLQSLGRAQTQLLDINESIEEELDLVLLHLGYEHLTENGLFFYGEFSVGGGQLVGDAIEDDRQRLSASTQSIIAYRPKLGLGWRNGPVDLGLAWQITYAEGQWYPNDAYGSEDGSGPPENSGILSQGLQLEIGFNL